MTASMTAHQTAPAVRPHPSRARGVDLLVMRLSVAALRWARRRADRAIPVREHIIAVRDTHEATRVREHSFATRAEAPRY